MSTDRATGLDDADRLGLKLDEPSATPDKPSRSARLALLAFVAYLVIAFFELQHLGRHYWFYQDEWTLILRKLNSPSLLIQPLNQHWVTLPLLLYHLLFWLFGLNYRPYQIASITLHLSLVVLLRVLMRRAGVGPWLATLAAGTFVIYSAGSLNILQSVQMCLVGSVVFGVCHLLCADHDGRFDGRDALGLAFGGIALMCSGIGTIMVAIVGAAVMFRRGWRMAALHVLPLATLNAAWYFSQRRFQAVTPSKHPLKYVWQWNISGVRAVFTGLGDYTVVAVALAAMLVVGLIIAWRPLDVADLRKHASIPAAMLLGVPILLSLVSLKRYYLDEADSSKFVHICTAFTLPALAIAAQAIIRRWHTLTPVVVALLLIGVPANLTNFTADGIFLPGFFAHERAMVLGAAYSPLANHVPKRLTPYNEPYGAGGVSIAFLLNARNAGRLPPPPVLSPSKRDELTVRLGVQQIFSALPNTVTCEPYSGPFPLVLHPAKGDVYGVNQTTKVQYQNPNQHRYWGTVVFNPAPGGYVVLKIQLPNLRLFVNPYYYPTSATPFTVCKARVPYRSPSLRNLPRANTRRQTAR